MNKLAITNWRGGRWLLLLLAVGFLGACVYLRLYEFKLQLEDFDENFSITSEEYFTLHFKDPMLYSEDFVTLAKLQPTRARITEGKATWYYRFDQVDGNDQLIPDGVSLLFQLDFNDEDLLADWHFSPLFLEMVPAEFLEASLRSLGTAEIDKSERQVRAAAGSLPEINQLLPIRSHMVDILGAPISLEERDDVDVLEYRFLLDTPEVEEGYEDRRITHVKLYFSNETERLVRVKGRFAGLKLSIDYRKFGQQAENEAD